ncbi:MAG: hypothetical protein GY774_02445 [Planctomycetes bacterium]|nr:hypothetical protein [Planctomycetota bacterium]
MRRKSWLITATLLTLAIQGCTERVLAPPRIDLKQQEVVGIIEFDCSDQGELGPFLTHRFVDAIRRDQELVRIVLLGTPEDVLADIGQSRLDQNAFKAIGQKRQIKTVFTGNVVISDVKPNVAIGQSLTYFGVSADVDATLNTQMVETDTGASLWSRSARAVQRIGGVEIFGDKSFTFDAEDPEDAYSHLADSLVKAVTHDFRCHWVRVKKK